MMQTKRTTIALDPYLKASLEQLAKANYRTLNGEINKALEFYLLSQGQEVARQKDILTTPTPIAEAPSLPQREAVVYHNTSYDEIEEF